MRRLFVRSTYLTRTTGGAVFAAGRPSGWGQTRISILTTQRQPSANLQRQYVWGFQHLH